MTEPSAHKISFKFLLNHLYIYFHHHNIFPFKCFFLLLYLPCEVESSVFVTPDRDRTNFFSVNFNIQYITSCCLFFDLQREICTHTHAQFHYFIE